MKHLIKRFFDFSVACTLLILLSPMFLILILMNWWILNRPIFFIQERIGYQERAFKLIKLRTMKNDKDSDGNLLPDEFRLTAYGSLLRKLSFDELPTLINVIKGDMSLVGPRPLLPEYLPHYTPEQRRRHMVKPGITGLAQVNGRNVLSWEEKFAYDIAYVNQQSFFLDIKILFQTIFTVIFAKNINHQGHVTMPRFDQTEKQP